MTVDLAALPEPEVVEGLSYASILAEMRADLEGKGYTGFVAGDPAVAVLEVAAYREMILRQRVNDAARQVMVAFSAGTNLDHLAAFYGVERGDGESDASLLARLLLAPAGFSVAGPTRAYEFHARTVDPDAIADVAVLSPTPGIVRVVVLPATDMDTGPLNALLLEIEIALNDEAIRPLCDTVEVIAATALDRRVSVQYWLFPGAASEPAEAAMTTALEEYSAQRVIGRDVMRSKMAALAHVEGVHSVVVTLQELTAPDTWADLPGDEFVDDEHWARLAEPVFAFEGFRE
jgi:phage-related baseplate assembly protein